MNSKKMFKTLLVFVVSVFTIMCVPLSSYAKEEQSEPSKEEITEDFNKLQSEIDKVLLIENNHYVFNENEVYKVVSDYNFDFNTFNKYYETNYTSDTFAKYAIVLIKDADLSYKPIESSDVCEINGTYCGRNANTSGWNYNRYYRNKSKSAEAINNLRNAANTAGDIGVGIDVIEKIFPGITSAFGIGAKISEWYLDTLADAIASNNKDGDCGTVTDINKFTTVFTVWSQKEFVE